MPAHVIDSPTHGQLRVTTWRDDEARGRVWRAVLDPSPPRLVHVRWVEATTHAEVLELMRQTVELYDGEPAVPAEPGHLVHDEAAPTGLVGG